MKEAAKTLSQRLGYGSAEASPEKEIQKIRETRPHGRKLSSMDNSP
jgi:hypothetical protein